MSGSHENGEGEQLSGVLVTGATTTLGEALVGQLLADGRVGHVIGVGVEAPEDVAFLPKSERYTYIQVDLTRTRHMRRLLFGPVRKLQVEVVLHAASHRKARDSGRKIHALNVESTRSLLQLAEQHPTIKRFVLRSWGEIYKLRAELPSLIGEEHPLALSPDVPQWLRDRVEADLTVCTRMGLSPLHIVVLRAAECLAEGTGSQLYDYLQSDVCFRPLGFDPMINVLSVEDMVHACHRALFCEAQGVFNIPGKDTLPLSQVIKHAGRLDVPAPGPMLSPLYWARSLVTGTDFRYNLNRWRFHFNAVLDGTRAQRELGYKPLHSVRWDVLCAK